VSGATILFVAYQTANHSNGGMESATQILEQLGPHNTWILATNRESGFTERWRKAGAQVHLMNFDAESARLSRWRNFLLWARAIRALIRAHSVDLVHVNDIRAGIVVRLALMFVRRQVPMAMTERDLKAKGQRYGRHWPWVAGRCSAIVALSEEMKQGLAERAGIPAERIRVINSIVDTKKLGGPLQDGAAPEAGPIRVGVIGAFMDKKNQLQLIEQIVARFSATSQALEFHFAGDFRPDRDAYAQQCQVVASRAPTGLLRIHGHIADVGGFLRSLDLVLVASRNEGLARCMIESLCLGIPVVSFDVCSAKEFIEETGAGVVVPQGDYEALFDAVERVGRPGSQARTLARSHVQAFVQRLSAARAREAFLTLYRDLLPDMARRSS
jgi:glycosyltransferase involved in cell wall biosynthesis